MAPMKNLLIQAQSWLDATRALDFLAPLALRLYLTPIFWTAGLQKYSHFADTVEWFGNTEWGLGLPFPTVMAFLATAAELAGAVSLALGLALRWMCVPMIFTMLVAIFTVHWHNGWLAIAEGMGLFANERTMEAAQRLMEAKEILMQSGVYDRLTEYGSLVILNNGVEFAVTYAAMLLVLFFIGGGRYVSVDYWIRRIRYADAAVITPSPRFCELCGRIKVRTRQQFLTRPSGHLTKGAVNMTKKPLAVAIGAAFALTGFAAHASVFQATDLAAGYMVASAGDAKTGEAKCGEKKGEAKCGEKKADGKCGEKKADGKCGEKKADGKCGEGKCGEKKGAKKADGKCGEGKCGEKK